MWNKWKPTLELLSSVALFLNTIASPVLRPAGGETPRWWACSVESTARISWGAMICLSTNPHGLACPRCPLFASCTFSYPSCSTVAGFSSALCSCCSAANSEHNEKQLTYNYSKRKQFATEIIGRIMTIRNLHNVLCLILTYNST